MIRRLCVGFACLAVLAFALTVAACGDDDDATPTPVPTPDPAQIAEIEDTFTKMLETDPAASAEVDFFLAHITADAVKYFGYPTAEECRAAVEDCIGQPTEVSETSDTSITGDTATTTATSADGQVQGAFTREAGVWKLDGYALTAPVPTGAATVEVSAVDYGYDWDKTKAVAGNTVFTLKNDGTQAHELAITSVADDFDIQTLITAAEAGELGGDTLPEGVTGFVGFAIATPGLSANAVIEGGLEPGKYAFICSLPDPEGKPHVAHGMYSEFTVQ